MRCDYGRLSHRPWHRAAKAPASPHPRQHFRQQTLDRRRPQEAANLRSAAPSALVCGLLRQIQSHCQGEGRGFESRRPLSKFITQQGFVGVGADHAVVICPSTAHHLPMTPLRSLAARGTEVAMAGSLRQRGPDSWELRVYVGTDPETHQRRYATRTIRGTRRAATRAPAETGRARRRRPPLRWDGL